MDLLAVLADLIADDRELRPEFCGIVLRRGARAARKPGDLDVERAIVPGWKSFGSIQSRESGCSSTGSPGATRR